MFIYNKTIRSTAILIVVLLQSYHAKSADTLKITIAKADSVFLIRNLQLLSAKYNISAAKALKIQAKVYPNPTLYVEQSVINKFTRASYDNDPSRQGNSETIIQLNQLILLAGKRNKQVKLADFDVKLSETDFENLLRTLRYQLHSNLSQLYYNQQALKLLKEEQNSIYQLSDHIDEQVIKGFISLSEGVRIKSLLLEIDKQIIDYSNTNYDIIAEINTFLNLPEKTFISANKEPNYTFNLSEYSTYLDSATIYNLDIKKLNYLVDAHKAQYNLNKAMAVPDLNVQAVYDSNGNYIKNYIGLGIGIDLPAFNRNQGNIKAAKFRISESETDLKLQQQTVSSVLFANYQSTLNNQLILKNYATNYEQQLLKMMDAVLENYQKRIITLVDFTNYYESYKQGYLSLLQIKASLIHNVEQLNFLIGKPIIK